MFCCRSYESKIRCRYIQSKNYNIVRSSDVLWLMAFSLKTWTSWYKFTILSYCRWVKPSRQTVTLNLWLLLRFELSMLTTVLVVGHFSQVQVQWVGPRSSWLGLVLFPSNKTILDAPLCLFNKKKFLISVLRAGSSCCLRQNAQVMWFKKNGIF